MSKHDNGGPAFPHIDSACGRFDPGMTLRDYFAAKASDKDIDKMREFVPAVDKVKDLGDGNKRVFYGAEPDNWRQVARYLHADAMLKARQS